MLVLSSCEPVPPSWLEPLADGEWPSYGGDAGSRRYSPLEQIDASNVADLQVVWQWTSIDQPLLDAEASLRSLSLQATPILEGGVLYTSTSLSQVAAIDPGTGETRWSYDPESWKQGRPPNWGFVHRGVAHWTDGVAERILIGTGSGEVISIDAGTGRPDPAFGSAGRVSIRDGLARLTNPRQVGLSSPPVIAGDVAIVGSSISDGAVRQAMPPGRVIGYDVRTGERLWTFDTVPQGDAVGADTWNDGSAEYTGNTNAWAPMSVDTERGLVYFGVGTPSNDWYGGHRHGDNLFSESVVCLRAATGELVWHFQIVHHGMWDYDLPAAPILTDIVADGRAIPALVQLTKQGFAFVFDRVTGEPVWPIEERAVAASTVPGEKAAPTQPFPTKPPPFERQGVGRDDLIDFTPELRKKAEEILDQYVWGPLYTPPTVIEEEPGEDGRLTLGTVQLPGSSGGANWGGGSFDPDTGLLYVPSITSPIVVGLVEPDPARSNFRYVRPGRNVIEGPDGLPLLKPPWGRISAIDLHRGEIAWQVARGDGPRDHELLQDLDLPQLGQVGRAGPLLTKSLLFVADGTIRTNSAGRKGGSPFFRAYDKATGAVVATIELPGDATGTPMTYLHRDKQYIVVAVTSDEGQSLVALGLP